MKNPDFILSFFILGCIGALAPEIVRLYRLRTKAEAFEWSWFYLIISVLFSGLGGLIAWILPATTYYGAFYAGVTTPVIVTTMLKQTKALGEREELKHVREMVRKPETEPTEPPPAAEERVAARGTWGSRISVRHPLILLNDFVNAL
ncbi:MAG: hypothetical protein JSU74_03230 [Candidatus Zixiibacteriota bacterium]|nr:MAG: hypothetical protein JSU74_03230 [candidate division Zixibacteria bacterium]